MSTDPASTAGHSYWSARQSTVTIPSQKMCQELKTMIREWEALAANDYEALDEYMVKPYPEEMQRLVRDDASCAACTALSKPTGTRPYEIALRDCERIGTTRVEGPPLHPTGHLTTEETLKPWSILYWRRKRENDKGKDKDQGQSHHFVDEWSRPCMVGLCKSHRNALSLYNLSIGKANPMDMKNVAQMLSDDKHLDEASKGLLRSFAFQGHPTSWESATILNNIWRDPTRWLGRPVTWLELSAEQQGSFMSSLRTFARQRFDVKRLLEEETTPTWKKRLRSISQRISSLVDSRDRPKKLWVG